MGCPSGSSHWQVQPTHTDIIHDRYKAAGANATDDCGTLDTVDIAKDDALAGPNLIAEPIPPQFKPAWKPVSFPLSVNRLR